MWLFVFALGALGLLGLVSPHSSWQLSNFWRFEGAAEPSDFSLLMYRLQGALFVLVALGLAVYGR